MSRKIIIIVMVGAAIMLYGVGYSLAATITLEVGADTPAVSIGKTHNVAARVLLRPIKPPSGSEKGRAPLAVALVIDKSSSMSENGKMENAKRGAIEALKFLNERDIATVITYDTMVYVLTNARSVNDMEYFTSRISHLKAGGNTALYNGVEMGAKEIERFLELGYVPRIILLSDGLANVGPSSVSELASLGRSLSRRGMTITTIGLGLDYDEDLMTALAAESGGNAYFARTKDRLEDIFRRDMEDATAITGRSVRVKISCEGDVRPLRSVGRSGKGSAKEIVVDIDNLYGAEKYAIFELEVPAYENEAKIRAATINVEYTDSITGETVSLSSYLDIEYTASDNYAEKRRDAEIAAQAENARNAEILEQAIVLSDSGKAEEASALLRERAVYLAAPEYQNDESIQKDINYLNSLADNISAEGEMSNEDRKGSVSRSYATKNQQAPVSSDDDEE
jgi:Ca-activated chloride channel family protein